MIDGLTLIGSGMDSCVIDSREFSYVSGFYTFEVFDSCSLSNFRILTYDINRGTGIIITSGINTIVEYCRVQEAVEGITINAGTQNKPVVSKNIISNVSDGITTLFAQSIIKDNIIYPDDDGLVSQLNSSPRYLNNTIICETCNTGHTDYGFLSTLYNNVFYRIGYGG